MFLLLPVAVAEATGIKTVLVAAVLEVCGR
jgi:hypothetical protein